MRFRDEQDFLEWVAKEAEGCEICGSHEKLCIDHDHKTGEVRGVLCQGCNQAIGCMGDCKIRLQKAIVYLQRCQGVASGLG